MNGKVGGHVAANFWSLRVGQLAATFVFSREGGLVKKPSKMSIPPKQFSRAL